jgi:alpha-glucosidase
MLNLPMDLPHGSSPVRPLLPISMNRKLIADHDVVRHATRYGIPDAVEKGGLSFASFCREYLKSGGTKPECNFEQGLARARAATLMMLALPGSAYLYQYVPLVSSDIADKLGEKN